MGLWLEGVFKDLPRVQRVFGEEFPRAKVQRCQVYVARGGMQMV